MKELENLKMKVLGMDIFPTLTWGVGLLPDKTRKNISTKQHAPSKDVFLLDRYDCLGTSPYDTKEILDGKLWRVTYYMEQKGFTSSKEKKAAKGFGMDYNDETARAKILAGAASEGEKAVENVAADLEKIQGWWNKMEWTNEERFSVPPHVLNCMVVKLNSGSLLLYAPVRVRDEVGFRSWLDGLGKVEWIVISSSFHTLWLPAILARYPDAKVIGGAQAEDKLNYAGALVRKKLDYRTTAEDELATANQELETEGVKLFLVQGEVMCNSLMVVAHGVLLTCDLVYNRHDGGIFGVAKEEFDMYKEEHAPLRLFKYRHCNKPNSPNGFLAGYRFMAMDHNGLGRMGWEQPAKDGSTCRLMAASLREALQMDFTSAIGVHFDFMDREDFRKTIDANWNWLDGKSLI